MDDRLSDVVRQGFEPIRVVALQRHVERDDIFYLAAVDGAIENRCPRCGEAQQECLLALVGRTLEEGTRADGKMEFSAWPRNA